MRGRIGALALLLAVGAMTFAGAGISATSAKKPKKKLDPTCGKARAAKRTVDGTLGSVTISGTPKRVVALEFSFVDHLASIGVKPVGIADDNDPARIIPPLRPLVAGYTSVGTRAAPSLEKIASLHPDLIIADATRHAKILNQLKDIAPTIALDSLDQAYLPNLHSAILVGQLLNKCGAMRVRVAQDKAIMARMKAAVRKATDGNGEKRKAMFAVTTNKVFNMHTGNAYTGSLLAYIGIPQAVVGSRKEPTKELTLESLITTNPEILFIAQNPPAPTTDQNFAKSPLWEQIKAAKNKQVFYVNTNLWSKARGIVAGEVIAQQAVHLLYGKYVSIKLPKAALK